MYSREGKKTKHPMTNKEIAAAFNQLSKLMELHGENPYKIRSYQSAYRNLRSLPEPLSGMSETEIRGLKGVGDAIAGKIGELLTGRRMATLERYREKTPEGLQEMLNIKGFGPKKIRRIWKDLGVETIGELLYACNENRLVELKGFGLKTQDQLRRQLQYYLNARGKYHYASLEKVGEVLVEELRRTFGPDTPVAMVGALRRRCEVLEKVELLIGQEGSVGEVLEEKGWTVESHPDGSLRWLQDAEVPVTLYTCAPEAFGSRLFRYTGSPEFVQAFLEKSKVDDFRGLATEKEVFEKAGLAYLPPELREDDRWLGRSAPRLVEEKDICGVVHAHTTWSDGLNTLREMAEACRDRGFEYLALTDHSQAAFYANGLKPERLLEQLREIDTLNEELAPFRIFKGVESDILADGSLDYEDDILAQLDFVIASVHSNLRMDEEKATRRILRAVENPYTTILGHPTGRLLLSREGYPLDHKRIIDACAEHGVVIELNANPWRLDLDWRWIPYAREKGVLISINPDAHSIEGIGDIHYGLAAARKGGLEALGCLNCLDISAFSDYLIRRKEAI